MKRRHSVTDEEWARIEPLLPQPKKMGRPPKDMRELTDAILWIFKTGAPWRDLPEYFCLMENSLQQFPAVAG
jgi:transposase